MVNNLEGYAEYAVQKKLKAKDRMPVVASAALMVVGLAIWTFIAGWVGPSILIIGIALTIITATRQELEYEYIFVNGDCEISKIVKRSSRKKVYEFEAGKIQKVLPYTSILFDNERQAHPDMIIGITLPAFRTGKRSGTHSSTTAKTARKRGIVN